MKTLRILRLNEFFLSLDKCKEIRESRPAEPAALDRVGERRLRRFGEVPIVMFVLPKTSVNDPELDSIMSSRTQLRGNSLNTKETEE